MRIALVTWSRRRAGGVETYVEHVIAALVAAGHAVALWYEADQPQSAAPIALPPGVPAVDVGRVRAEALGWQPDGLILNGLLDVDLEARLLSAAPSLFVAHNFYGTCISGTKTWAFPVERPCTRRFAPACLLHYFPHRCGGLNPVTMLTLYERERRRQAGLARAGRIVTLSNFMRDEYRNHGFADDRVVCVPYGPPPRANAEPVAEGKRASRGSLVFVGRLERLKGVHVLLEALPEAAERLGAPLSLAIVGDGPEREPLAGQVRDVETRHPNVKISFKGRLSPDDRDRCLAAADLLVVPSLWPEPFGLVGLEAGRLGVPAVAFDVGGIRQWLVDGENGRLVPADPPTASALAEALASVLGDADGLVRMRGRAAEIAGAGPTPAAHAAALAAMVTAVRAEANAG